jgi:nitroreductase
MAVLTRAARAAGMAPSVHNTQPWRWLVHRDHLDLYAERSRQLQVTDPDGRLLMISCGAALHHARVALAAEGWQAEVTRLPDPHQPDHVARVVPTRHTGVTPEAVRLFQAAERRHSDRRPVAGTSVPREVLAEIRTAVEAEHAHLHLLPVEQVGDLAAAAARAGTVESADETLRAELSYWVGGQRATGAGVPDTVIPAAAAPTAVPQRDLGHGTLPTWPADDRAATYAVVFGEQDTPLGWLRAGEALSAAWLAACLCGVTVLPFSAPMEVTATRTVLRQLLAGLGHPYLVLRFGRADPDRPGPPHTPRLASTQTVRVVDDAG